jgi:glutamate dehydrogenase
MTDDVAAACLVNNYQQSLAISLTERRGVSEIGRAQRLMSILEGRGLVDRKLEALPTDGDLATRLANKAGLTRPEIAVLLAWSKIAVQHDILASSLPDAPGCADLLTTYFPDALRERYHEEILRHRLAREIISTRITNSIVNRGGPSFVQQLVDETGRSVPDVASAYLVIREIFDLPRLWSAIDALDGAIGGQLQLDLYAQTQDLLLTETGELLRASGRRSIGDAFGRYRPAAAQLESCLDSVLPPAPRRARRNAGERTIAAGVPAELAWRLAALPYIGVASHAADLAERSGADLPTAAAAIFAAETHLRLDALRSRVAGLHLADYYDALAIQGALGAIETACRTIAGAALGAKMPIGEWLGANAARLERTKATLDAIADAGEITVSRLVIAATQVRDITT